MKCVMCMCVHVYMCAGARVCLDVVGMCVYTSMRECES